MEKGFNSDIIFRGEKFHVQTEDWGPSSSLVVSKIFKNGAVLKTFKNPYPIHFSRSHIRHVLKSQHTEILDLLLSGKI